LNRNASRRSSPATIRIQLHGPEDFTAMRAAGRLAAETLDFITPHVRPGVTTEELDRLCHDHTAAAGAVSAPLNYKGFPKSICTSVNEVICHGIPGDRRLLDGDIINIDVTPLVDGWHGDSSRTYFVGKVADATRRLVANTYECMMRGIDAVRPGPAWGISATPSSPMPRRPATRWCAVSVGTASARHFIPPHRSSTLAARAVGPNYVPACSSPSNR
jgi:hypothetical protein